MIYMKKKLLISIMALASVFSLVGCAKKQNRTVEYLFDRYVEAYSKANVEAAKDIYPPYYVESAKQYLSKEYLDSNLKTSSLPSLVKVSNGGVSTTYTTINKITSELQTVMTNNK